MKKLNWKSILGWGIAALVAGFIVYTNMQGQKALQESGKRNVYAVLPLSGVLTEIGKSMKDIMTEWQKVHPDALFNIQYIDSQSRPDAALSALNQATMYDEHPVVLTALSTIGNVLSPIIKQKNGFGFGVFTLPLKENLGNYQRVSNSIEDYMPSLIRHLKTLSTLAVIYIEDDYGVLASTELIKRYTANGGKITNKIALDLKQKDVRIEVEKVLQNNPEGVVVIGMTTLAYINTFRELGIRGYKGEILSDYALALPYIQKAIGPYMENTFLSVLELKKDRENEVTIAVNNANTTFHHMPAEVWDTLDLIQYTLEHNLPFTQETYTKMGKWKGVAGDVIFPGNGDSLYPFILVQYKNGKFVPVEN